MHHNDNNLFDTQSHVDLTQVDIDQMARPTRYMFYETEVKGAKDLFPFIACILLVSVIMGVMCWMWIGAQQTRAAELIAGSGIPYTQQN